MSLLDTVSTLIGVEVHLNPSFISPSPIPYLESLTPSNSDAPTFIPPAPIISLPKEIRKKCNSSSTVTDEEKEKNRKKFRNDLFTLQTEEIFERWNNIERWPTVIVEDFIIEKNGKEEVITKSMIAEKTQQETSEMKIKQLNEEIKKMREKLENVDDENMTLKLKLFYANKEYIKGKKKIEELETEKKRDRRQIFELQYSNDLYIKKIEETITTKLKTARKKQKTFLDCLEKEKYIDNVVKNIEKRSVFLVKDRTLSSPTSTIQPPTSFKFDTELKNEIKDAISTHPDVMVLYVKK